MDRDQAIAQLVEYAKQTGLIQECETVWAVNTVLDALKLDSWTDPGPVEAPGELAPVLEFLLDDAHQRGVLEENSVIVATGNEELLAEVNNAIAQFKASDAYVDLQVKWGLTAAETETTETEGTEESSEAEGTESTPEESSSSEAA